MRGSFMLLGIVVVLSAAWLVSAGPEPAQFQKTAPQKPAETKTEEPARSKADKAADEAATEAKAQADAVSADEETLKNAGVAPEGPALLKFFRTRILPDGERDQVQRFIRQLGSDTYRMREEAAAHLIADGPKVMEILRGSLHGSDLEVVRRLERCLARIQEGDASAEVHLAVVRTLARLKPAGTVEVMLAYLPFTDDDQLVDEIRKQLTVLGKGEPLLRAALTDAQPLRRAVAAEALARVDFTANQAAVTRLLSDPEAMVRARVAEALVYARRSDAVPVLINALPDLPLNRAWQAEDFLFRLAESTGRMPPAASLAGDTASRQKCRDTWLAWWQAEAPQVDLARMQESPKMLGRTLLVLLDQGQVKELGPKNEVRWQVDGLVFPLDVQLLDDAKHILVAEYHANQVSVRDLRGNLIWKKAVPGPLVAQRLANGHTFVATDSFFVEYDKAGNEVLNLSIAEEGKKIMKAMKLPSGEVACLTSDARVVRYDVSGKELKEIQGFNVPIAMRLFGGRIHMLPSGRVLVPHNAEDKVVEYDARGKVIWETTAEKPVAATRLPNGHTLITSMNPAVGAVEVDRNGREVWAYRATTRVTRALKR